VKQYEVKMLPINSVIPNQWNPNVEDPDTFNELVENIKDVGFVDPIQVVPVEGGYMIVGGEHRWKAAKLAGLEEIPAVILEGWDEDLQKAQTVRMNVIKGKLDPEKFTRLFKELERKYGKDAARRMVGLANKDAEFRRLLKETTKDMPAEVRKELEKRLDKIRNVEDLAAVVNSLYAKFGSTLKHNFMFLTYGGKMHLMVRLSPEAFAKVEALAQKCAEEERDINEVMEERLLAT